ncbi:hypothetical protein DKX38_011865 [Salix brachista]|uniref:Uncharacterized protein n=1 Tax=Salix brachista TaxID=2182728 RepID=A0A5N5M052_9ROSI|nr:hypothetical protein DKX38_011865 [Salix brachista]
MKDERSVDLGGGKALETVSIDHSTVILETRNLESFSFPPPLHYCWDIKIGVHESPSILVALTTYDDNFELGLMKEHGVKEPRIRMLVMESNKIDLEKPQYDSTVTNERFELSCSLENLFGFMVRSSAGCSDRY